MRAKTWMTAVAIALALVCLLLQRQAHGRLERENARLRRVARFQELWRQTAGETDATATNLVERPFNWRTVESPDYPTYIANLRAIGCPEATVRDIVAADLDELLDYRRQALRGAGKRFEYWKANLDSTVRTVLEAQQELAREKRALLQDLLGVDPGDDGKTVPDKFQGEALLLEDFLPPTKAAEAASLLKKHRANLPRLVLSGNFSQFRQAELALERDLAASLEPEEFEDYRLRFSFPAKSLRAQLAPFEPSEQEFREIFKLWKNYGEEIAFGGPDRRTESWSAKTRVLQEEASAEIRACLGEQRYAEYERSMDPAYAAVYHVAQGQDLPKDTLIKAYEVESAAFHQRVSLDNEESLSPYQREAALGALRTEADAALNHLLGPKAAEALKRYSPYYNVKVTITRNPTGSTK